MAENPYKAFADAYDSAIDPAAYHLKTIKKLIPKKARVLDIGCGTGKYTIPLAEAGHNISGLDASREMLAVAKKKSAENGLKIGFLEGKIGSFSAEKKFGFAFSCDFFNHFMEFRELERAFYSVHSLLEKSGSFAFQYYGKKYFKEAATDLPYGGRAGKSYFVWENFFNGKNFEVLLTSFKPKKSGLFERIESSVFQTSFSPAKIKKALKKAGFRAIKPAKENKFEWVFLAKK